MYNPFWIVNVLMESYPSSLAPSIFASDSVGIKVLLIN